MIKPTWFVLSCYISCFPYYSDHIYTYISYGCCMHYRSGVYQEAGYWEAYHFLQLLMLLWSTLRSVHSMLVVEIARSILLRLMLKAILIAAMGSTSLAPLIQTGSNIFEFIDTESLDTWNILGNEMHITTLYVSIIAPVFLGLFNSMNFVIQHGCCI